MQITNLPASSSLASNDVLAIEVNGVTYKVTGATLAAAIKSIGSYVTTSDTVTTTKDGLMLSSDKSKLNGIASGAQVNSITGVKGSAEGSYRVGNVNLTPANIGAVTNNGPADFKVLNAALSQANDLYSLRGTVANSGNTARNGDDISFNIQNAGIALYDHTTGARVWETGPMVTIVGSATVPSSIGTTSRNTITRWGNIVTVALWVTLASGISASGTTIATVPADYRPGGTRYIGGWVSSAQSIDMFSINSSGQIQTATGSATYTGQVRIFATYAI